ncbi:acyl-CoA carboxylase epsilon subunit [Streptomyces sp. NPDC059072]|uniref:acyl-CoA carboxylase epsilon subunit n=1 Tax=unclassified Streptomyces TaxID=2593676 RepID=UPI00367D2C04
MTPQEQTDVLRFVRGRPDDEQIAAATLALIAVLRGGVHPALVERGGPAGPRWAFDRGYRAPRSWASVRRFGTGDRPL